MTAESGKSANQSIGVQAERGRDQREQARDRVHQQVLPDQRADRRHDEERRDHQQRATMLRPRTAGRTGARATCRTRCVITSTEPTSTNVLRSEYAEGRIGQEIR